MPAKAVIELDAEFPDELADGSEPAYEPSPPDADLTVLMGTVVTSVISPARVGSAGPRELSRSPATVPPAASSAQTPTIASTTRLRRPIAQARRGLSGPISRTSPSSGPDPSMFCILDGGVVFRREAQRAASKAVPTSVAAGPGLNRPVVPLPAETGSANQA